jgi:hypothetical protein
MSHEDVESLRKKAFEIPREDQFRLAFFIAENIGYMLKNNTEVMDMAKVDKDEVIIGLRKELERSRDLRAKLELQSMNAMDKLRVQVRSLGAEPVL